MPFGLPARDEANWDTKLNDSINAVKATADAAQPAATLDAGVTAVDADAASAFRVQQDARLSATFARVTTPEKHSAVGDGVANDTAAVTAAVAELVAGDTLFLRRTYLTTASHAIPAGVTVDGPGTLKRSGATTTAILTLGADCKVRNVTLDGSATVQYVAQVAGDRVTFDNCEINDSDLYGIGCNGYADLAVTGCRFYDNDLYAVLVENTAPRARIVGNFVKNAADGSGIFLKSGGTRITDGLIANNVVDIGATGALGIEYWGDRGSVTGNTVRCAGASIGISLAGATYTAVSGNTVTYSAAGSYGIEMAEATSNCSTTGNVVSGATVGIIVSKGGAASGPTDNVLSSNVIRGTSSYGIDLEYAERCVITGNLVDMSATATAILIANGTANSHHMVSGNTIIRRAAGNGISATGSYVTVTGNHIDCTLAVGGQGISYGSGANYGLITNNHVVGAADGIVVSGTHTFISGNQTLNTTSYVINMGGSADYNVVGAHYGQNDGGNQVTIVGANSRAMGPIYSRGLNRAEVRARLGVENAVAATTPGTVTNKIEVFSQTGASLGFLPVYGTIT